MQRDRRGKMASDGKGALMPLMMSPESRFPLDDNGSQSDLWLAYGSEFVSE